MPAFRTKARMVLNLLKPKIDTRPVLITVYNQAGRYIDTMTMHVGDSHYFGLLFGSNLLIKGEHRAIIQQRRITGDVWIVTVYMPIDLPQDPEWPGWSDWEAFNDYVDANGGTL